MNYIREILNSKEETIRIKIPKEFINRNLELTIKPVEESEEEKRKKLLKFLSESPEMAEEEYNDISERRKRFDAWH